MLFTARKASDPSVAHLVLAVDGGNLLLADDSQGELLEWVPAKTCLLGRIYLDAGQREWWRGLQETHEHD